jgi:hypothetical protein
VRDPLSLDWDLQEAADIVLSPLTSHVGTLCKLSNCNQINFSYSNLSWALNWGEQDSQKLSESGIDEGILGSYRQIGLPDVSIKIVLGIYPASGFWIDGFHRYDSSDQTTVGDVSIEVMMNPEKVDVGTLLRRLRGTLVHEFFHVGRWALSGLTPGSDSFSSIDKHLKDPEEVGARVEEVLAMISVDSNPADPNVFAQVLKESVHDYLSRNGVSIDDPKREVWASSMFNAHMTEYRYLMGLFG